MKKTTFFFLRGLVRESAHWSGFVETFQKSYPECNIVLLDLPGSGKYFQSSCPTSISKIVDFLRTEFLANKSEENYFFAVSLGAMVGFHWLQKYEEDFRGGIFANTSMRGLNPFYRRLLPQNYWKIFSLFFSNDSKKLERTILAITSENCSRFAELEKSWSELHKIRPVSKANAIRQLLAAAKYSPSPKKPKAKILLLNGSKDQLVSPKCSEAIAKFWDVPLKTNALAGHDITLDQPEWVIEQVKNFVS
jgi:pimeloyl-[acyl-carrier protein] methyl ester esterase